ncbi:PAS domain S-box protein [Anabaena sp. PCC 7108]|uniref:PAS domain S-box protein n=1 Tax=Anabaena sp. PCC 7108 TaxID=163908 RepID=UPI00034B3A13|nr:PAS domain S-box protein [Anabaena sp. PCC 7108]
MNDTAVRWFVKPFANLPLRTLLIVPFVLQTVGIVTLVGYFSYRSGQEAVENLADQLMTEVDDRIEQHLDNYLGKAQEINRINVDAFESGILDLNNFSTLGKYFYRQVQSLNFAYINFGSQKGGFIGAGYGLDNKLGIGEIPISDLSEIRSYSVDNQGNRLKLKRTIKNPQTNNAAWYLDAVKAGKPIWSSIYTWGDLPDRISISASTPVYDGQENLLGVLGIDLELSQISRFLKTLNSRRSGHISIVERSGLIVASSEDESPAPIVNGKATRLQALNSREPVIREVTQHLMQRFGSLKAISKPHTLRPDLEQKCFIRITPYRDDYGLNWLVVTVIPESEFMAEIHANAHRTLLFCCLALVIAIGTGSLTAYWIAKPILRLSQASQAMAKGEWQESLSEDIAIAELKVFATSFNQMSVQIKKAFQESETKFLTIFNTTPDPVWISTLEEGRCLNVNESFCNFWGDTAENIIGKTCTELGMWENLEDFHHFRQTLVNESIILNFQVRMYTYSRQIQTVLISARVQSLDGQDCIIGVMKDITDLYNELRLRKQAEHTLLESEHRFRSLFENSPVAYQSLDEQGCFIDVNSQLCDLLGYTKSELIGRSFGELWTLKTQPYFIEAFEHLKCNKKVSAELYLTKKDGGEIVVLLEGRIQQELEGQFVKTHCVLYDITERKYMEDALQYSQNLLQTLASNIPGTMYTLVQHSDKSFTFEYVSLGCRYLLELEPEEILANSSLYFQQIHPDDRAGYNQAVAFSAKKLEPFFYEWRIITPADKLKWVQANSRPELQQNGDVVWRGVLLDISKRKQAEEALQKSEAMLLEAQHLAHIGNWKYDVITGKITWSNELFHIVGRDPILGEPTYEENLQLYHPEDAKLLNQAVKRALFTGESYQLELRIINADGSFRYTEGRGRAELNAEGKVIRLFGTSQDITERKQIEDKLLESQHFIQKITELTPNLLYIYDHIEQRNVYVNSYVAEILGYSAAEIQEMGANLFPIICHPDDLHLVYEAMQQLDSLQNRDFVEVEYRVRNTQGKWCWLYSRDMVFARTADGSLRQTLGTSQDITARKEAELELRKSRDFKEAIYNASPDAIFLVDVPNPLILDCNSRAVEMFEVASKEELIGIEGQTLQKRQFTDDEIAIIVDDIANLGCWSQEIEYVTKKGKNFWGNLAVKRIDIAGKTIDLVRVTDISNRKQAELALLNSEKRFKEISESCPGVIYITVMRLDSSWYYEYISHEFEDIHELTVEQVLENPHLCFEQFHPDDCIAYQQAVAHSVKTMSPFNYEWRIITPSGKIKWIKARSRPERRENGEIAFYGVVLDVSERKQIEENLKQAQHDLRLANQELEQLVNTDGLTQIANRRCFDNRLQQEWQRLYREQQPLSLLLFDVDYFKRYNDSYGHQLGDECLIKIAQSAKQVVCRSMDLVARYGGEEFVVILPKTNIEGALAIAQRIHVAITDMAIPHQASKVSDIVTVSLGIAAQIPTAEVSASTLVEQADQALYRAKQQGRNQSVIFSFWE